MAKESFDKEIQFLRMLVLTSGAYSRQQFADRLGISVHTFDKTLRRLKRNRSHDVSTGTGCAKERIRRDAALQLLRFNGSYAAVLISSEVIERIRKSANIYVCLLL